MSSLGPVCKCGEHFGSLKWCHCWVCHETFSTERAFDKHRVGGVCHDPESVAGLLRSGAKATGLGKAVWTAGTGWSPDLLKRGSDLASPSVPEPG